MANDDQPLNKKSLGQHWLNDEDSLDEMLKAADISYKDTVLEIGPGLGSLTRKLVEKAHRVVAIELDEDLADNLQSRVSATNLEVVKQDILRFNLTNLPVGYKVVANIPYYLTSKLLRTLCESANPFNKAAILVQKEVAERVAAKPGSMGLLSVSVQYYCNVSLGAEVHAELFTPPPKVDSQILKLTFRKAPLFSEIDDKAFFLIVKAGFSQRRKTLLNSLSSGLRLSREQTSDVLKRASIDTNARAQSLTLNDWYRLYIEINGKSKDSTSLH
jgi:16S rRNA (adenine1518-N6/adenine1519-N6)-dimethyltransferase